MLDIGGEDVEMVDVSFGEDEGTWCAETERGMEGEWEGEAILICVEVDFSGEVDGNGRRQGEEKNRQQMVARRVKILSA
jgi:hypothetical protein